MDRLDELISIYLEGAPTEADVELTRLLRANPDRARVLIEEYRLHQRLQSLYRPAQADAVENILRRLQDENNPFVESVIRNISRSRRAGKASAGAALFSWLNRHRPARGQSVAVAAGVVALLSLGLAAWMFFPVSGSPEVGLVQGSLSLERGGRAFDATAKTRLQRGDQLVTGPQSAVMLSFGREKTRFELGASTHLRVDQIGRGKCFSLLNGAIEARVARQSILRPMLISTPQAEARVLGTRFRLAVDDNETRLDVRKGKVRLTRNADGATAVLRSGMHALAGLGTTVAALPETGRILIETWTNYPGTFLELIGSDPGFEKRPDEQAYLTAFHSPLRRVARLGERVRVLQPPVSGNYRFWIGVAGRGEAHLFLSKDENPDNRRQIAEDDNSPNAGPSPPPADFPLVAGRQYYIEALHAGANDSQFTVRWEGPGRPRETLPGEFLSPPSANLKNKSK